MRKEHAKYLLSTYDIGEGNPGAILSLYDALRVEDEEAAYLFLTLSATPAKWFHEGMSQSRELSALYTKTGEILRGMAMQSFGFLSLLELVTHNPRWMLGKPSEYTACIGVQEHQFGGAPRNFWERVFPEGRFFFVPDVFPKQSGIRIITQKGFTALVWNEYAAELLQKEHGCEVRLVQPILPRGNHPEYSPMHLGPLEERVVVKSSGSGMPPVYTENLLSAFRKLDIPFAIHLPFEVITNDGTKEKSRNKREKIAAFYTDMYTSPPRVLITYPSEHVRTSAVLQSTGMRVGLLPSRGDHEVKNAHWMEQHRMHVVYIDPVRDDHFGKTIQMLYEERVDPIPSEQLGLGTLPLYEVLFNGK